MHLLSVVIPLPVSGGAVSEAKGRLDFDIPKPPENGDATEVERNEFVARDLPVFENWITEAELAASASLAKTMSVQPP